MTKKDTLQRFIFEDLPIRGELIHLAQSTHDIVTQHEYPPQVFDVLTQTLCASALLSALIKYEGQLTIQLQQSSAIKMLVAKCNDKLEIRGLAKIDEDATQASIHHDLNQGQVIITIEDSKKNKRYQSIVALQQQSIAAALESYFQQSEQLDTKLYLFNDGTDVFGLLLQALPDTNDAEKEKAWEYVTALANTTKINDFQTNDSETLLKKLFVEDNIRFFEPQSVQFKCSCSVAKMEDALRMYGEQQAQEILSTNQHISITCEYCNNAFDFDQSDVKRIFTTH